jgi:hypothetical protein
MKARHLGIEQDGVGAEPQRRFDSAQTVGLAGGAVPQVLEALPVQE